MPPPRLCAILSQVDTRNRPLGEPLLLTLTSPPLSGLRLRMALSNHEPGPATTFIPKPPVALHIDHTLDCSPGPRSPYLSSPHLLPNNPHHDGLLCSLRFSPVCLPWLLKYATVIPTFLRGPVSLSRVTGMIGVFSLFSSYLRSRSLFLNKHLASPVY